MHRALAEATDPEVDPDRRAWHRAQAAPGPDEDVAAELERSAGRAQARGGLAAAAAFLERAAELTPDPARRAQRALAAAQAKHQAGALDAALALLATAEAGPLDELQRARVDLLRAQIAFAVEPRQRRAPAAAQGRQAARAARRRRSRARPTWTRSSAAMFAGRLASGGGVLEVAEAARARARVAAPAAPGRSPPRRPGAADHRGLRGRGADAEAGADAPSAATSVSSEEELRWLWLACHAAHELWDDETLGRALHPPRSSSPARPARSPCSPSPSTRAPACTSSPASSPRPRRWSTRRRRSPRRPGAGLAPYGALMLAAWRGREAEATELIEASHRRRDRPRRGHRADGRRDWAAAVLYNGLGRYDGRARRGPAGQRAPGGARRSRPGRSVELIEAAARTGQARARLPTRSSGSRRRRAPAAPTGRWGSRPARARC